MAFFYGVKTMDNIALATAEEKYSESVKEYLETVYEKNLIRYLFVRQKVWRMSHQNSMEYNQVCDKLNVNTLLEKKT